MIATASVKLRGRPSGKAAIAPTTAMHLPTIIVMGALLSVLLAMVLGLTLRSAPSGSRGTLVTWSGAVALMAIYWLLFALVEFDYLPPAWMVAVNLLLVLALVGFLRAVRAFLHRPIAHTVLVGALLGLTAVLAWYGLPEPDKTASVVVVSIASAALLAVIAWSLRGAIAGHGGEARRYLQGLALIGMVLIAGRLGERLADPGSDEDTLSRLLVLLYIAVMPLFATFGFLMMHTDRANAELERQASTDPLTGALNRRALQQIADRYLSEARRHRRPASLLMVDADHFKLINDTYGHEAGDAVLCELLRRIQEMLRLEDVIGRIGGEEFVLLLPGTPEHEAMAVAERIRQRIGGETFIHRGEEIPLTVSIGVAEREPGEGDFETLLKRSDLAMYAAKRAGRNRVVSATAPAAA